MQVLVRSIVVALVLAVAASAHACPLSKPANPEAREHLERGNRLFEVGSFDEAIEEYKAGALIENAPLFLHNIALAYRMSGKRKESIFFYDQFKRRAHPTGEMLHEIDKLIDQMKSELEERSKAMPPTEPAPVTHGSESSKASETHGIQPSQHSVTSADRADTRQNGGRWYQDGVAWAITGTGIVAGGLAGVLFLQSSDLHDDAEAASTAGEAQALHDKANTRSTAGALTGISAGAILAVGIIKLAMHSSDATPDSVSWTVGASSNGFWVAGYGRF